MSKQKHRQCKDCAYHRKDSDKPVYDQCCIEPESIYRPRDYPCCGKIKPSTD